MVAKKDGAPIVFGLISILFIWMILGMNLMLMFYYKTLAEVSQVRQIACPDQKLCVAPKISSGHGYSVSVSFPSTIDGYTAGEQLSIPYFKSFDDPTVNTFTITFDKDTSVIPSGGVKFMNINGAGYRIDTPSTMTIYLKGVESYTTLDRFVPVLLRAGLTDVPSDLRKKAFARLSNDNSQDGEPIFNIKLKPHYSTLPAYSLSITSSLVDSSLLSGTNSLNFSPDTLINTGAVIDVYKDYQYISRYNIAPAFSKDPDEDTNEFTSCVDPSYIPTTCTGKMIDNEGNWVAEDADLNATYIPAWSQWSDFDTDTVTTVKMCTWNKNLEPGYYYGSAKNIYQTNKVANEVMDNTLVETKPSALKWSYKGSSVPITGAESNLGYVQDYVFCGGDAAVDTKNIPTEGEFPSLAEITENAGQRSVWPNNTNAVNDYTSIGFST